MECTLGLPCRLSLSGYRLNTTNKLVAISQGRCGDATATFANETWGIVNATNVSEDGVASSSYDFGIPLVGLAGSFYRLCWGFDPVDITDFGVEIDSEAELVGPFVREFECTLGLSCTVMLSGYRLSESNALVALTEGSCGDMNASYSSDSWTIQQPASLLDGGGNTSYDFGTPVAGLTGSFYKLCWSHESTDLEDMRVEIDGKAELVGPFVREFECTLGLPCAVVVSGYRLARTNAIVAIHSPDVLEGQLHVAPAPPLCGDSSAVVARNTWSSVNATNLSSNGTNAMYDFGTPTSGFAGSFYRLCWGHDPSSLTDFNVPLDDSAELVGPFVREMECTLGLPCQLSLSGYRLNATNKLVAISQGRCGDATATFANETWGIANATNVSRDVVGNSTYDFGIPLVGLAGSFYRLCWGHDPQSIEDFIVELEPDVELVGPFGREFECTLGVACSVFVEGYRLAPSNGLVLVWNSSCGDANAIVANDTWERESPRCSRGSPACFAPLPNTSYDFGTPVIGYPGDQYRLCWGHEPIELADYKYEIDATAELVGPITLDFECTLGSRCRRRLLGHRLAASNAIVVISNGTCGDPAATIAEDTWTIVTAATVGNESNASYDFGTPLVGAAGSFYRLCWGHNPRSAAVFDLAQFNVELDSTAELVGPFSMDLSCTLGLECAVVLEGYRLAVFNRLAVVQGTCGDPTALIANGTWPIVNPSWLANDTLSAYFQFGTPTSGAAGSVYRLCWGHGVGSSVTPTVEVDADVHVYGPDAVDLRCTLGVECNVSVTGYWLTSSNAIVVISNGSCGSAEAVLATETWGIVAPRTIACMGNGDNWTTLLKNETGGNESIACSGPGITNYSLGTPTAGLAGSFYRLCWGAMSSGSVQDFKVELDAFAELVGPYTEDLSCTLGVTCNITISGFGLVHANEVIVVSSGQCGDPDAVLSLSTWGGAKEPSSLSPGPTNSTPYANATFIFGTPMEGEPGAFYSLCWGHAPSSLADYKFAIDRSFELAGPRQGNYSCTLDVPCYANVSGFGFATSNKLVMGAYGPCGTSQFFPVSLYIAPHHISNDSTQITYFLGTPRFGLPGDFYRLCWAWDAPDEKLQYGITVDESFELLRDFSARRLRGR
jgi:hypothetical protein